jgi:tRNA(fMet)-specific endonuclease VapC
MVVILDTDLAYQRLHALLGFFNDIPVLNYSEGVAFHFGQLKRSKLRVGTMGLRIAAFALSLDAILLSSNLKDFGQVPQLRVEDWTI